MSQEQTDAPREQAIIEGLQGKPLPTKLWGYIKLTGPGWLQSAITLGGGSLASGLFLGVLAGFGMMWLQPFAMIMGIIMLSAIGYVALSTGERPFRAINVHVNPVLGWGWAIATAMANIVWSLPQFSLGVEATRQNLFPGSLGAMENEFASKIIATAAIFIICFVVIWFYDKGSRGIKIFEGLLKIMVGIIMLCFFGVVGVMTYQGALNWGAIGSGFIPDLSLLAKPAATFTAALGETGQYMDYWSKMIVGMQQDVMISASATAVGINMTFLLPYSMLAKGWNRSFRGFAIFDISTGLFIPFILATGCVVIASASQFHAQYHPGLVGEAYDKTKFEAPNKGLIGKYVGNLDGRIKAEIGAEAFGKLSDDEKKTAREALPLGDKKMAAMLVTRSAFDLAASLQPLTGKKVSHLIFGIGVLGMAISSIIILMLISGFVVCEMIGVKPEGAAHRWACMLPALGVLGPFIWSKAAFWLAVPTSLFGMVLAPIAYWTFFCLMNSRSLLGENMPKGASRLVWNVLMLCACAAATFGSVWVIWNKQKWIGIGCLGGFLLLALLVHIARKGKAQSAS